MKTITATLIVFLFCLPTFSQAADENRQLRQGSMAEWLLKSPHTEILYTECRNGTDILSDTLCHFMVKATSKSALHGIWDCRFKNYKKSSNLRDIDITCYAIQDGDPD